MENAKSAKHVFVVISGETDGMPEDVEILGVFSNEKEAFDFRNAVYKETNYLADEDECMGPDLNASYVEDAHAFWEVRESSFC